MALASSVKFKGDFRLYPDIDKGYIESIAQTKGGVTLFEYLVKVPDNMRPFHDVMFGTVCRGQVTYLTLVVGWFDLSMVLRYARSITF